MELITQLTLPLLWYVKLILKTNHHKFTSCYLDIQICHCYARTFTCLQDLMFISQYKEQPNFKSFIVFKIFNNLKVQLLHAPMPHHGDKEKSGAREVPRNPQG